MKLRLRHYQGGPTQRLEVDGSCSLRALRGAVASLTGQEKNRVRVSLNKVDELDGPGNVLVSSFGICSGDLLYLLDPRRPQLVGQPQIVRTASSSAGVSGQPLTRESGGKANPSLTAEDRRARCAAAAAKRQASLDEGNAASDSMEIDSAAKGGQKDNAAKGENTNESAASASNQEKRVARQDTALLQLQQVLLEMNLSVQSGRDLLILAVHAIMLDTGFRLVSGTTIQQQAGGRAILQYKLANNAQGNPLTCTLRCQQLGGNMLVYGSCDQDNQGLIFRLTIPLTRHLPRPAEIQSVVSGGLEGGSRAEVLSGLFQNARQLWRETKDVLSVPLLSLLYQRAGLSPPPSLILLPLDVKNNILVRLPAKALAAVSVTCTELLEAASGDELWKALFEKEFPHQRANVAPGKWKEEFGRAWVERKVMQERRQEYDRRMHLERREWRGFRYQPPGMVGGDYDRFPFGGGPGIPPSGFPGGLRGGPFGGGGGAFQGGNLDGGFSPSLGPDSLEWPHGGRAHFEAGRGPQGMPGIPGSNLPGFGPELRGGQPREGRPRRGGFSGSSII